MSISVEDVIANPEWRLCGLLPEKSELVFNRLDRGTIKNTNFVDLGFLNQEPGDYISLPMAELLEATESQPLPKMHFILHTAFCGSTLLSKGLDYPRNTLSIREPNAILQLAEFKRKHGSAVDTLEVWPRLVRLVCFLLARPFEQDEVVTIKLSNSMNNVVAELMQTVTNANVLVMTSSASQFAVSNLKKGNEYRDFCAQMIRMLLVDSVVPGLPIEQDPHLPVILWSMQQRQLLTQLSEFDSARIRLITIDQFLANKQKTLESLNRFFALGLNDQQIDELLASDTFSSHSKEKRSDFDEQQKVKEDQQIKQENAAEINKAEVFYEQHVAPLNENEPTELVGQLIGLISDE